MSRKFFLQHDFQWSLWGPMRHMRQNHVTRFHERSDPPDRGDPERSWVTLGRNSVPQTILTSRINDPEWSWLTLPLGRDHSGSLWLNMAANWFLCWYLPRQVARWPFSERHRLILSKLGQSTMVTLNLVRILCSFMIIQMLFRNFNGHTQQRPMSVCCVQWYWYPSPCSRPCKHGKHQRLCPLMLRIALGRRQNVACAMHTCRLVRAVYTGPMCWNQVNQWFVSVEQSEKPTWLTKWTLSTVKFEIRKKNPLKYFWRCNMETLLASLCWTEPNTR